MGPSLTTTSLHVFKNLRTRFFGLEDETITFVASPLDSAGSRYQNGLGVGLRLVPKLLGLCPALGHNLSSGKLSLVASFAEDRVGFCPYRRRLGLGIRHQLFGRLLGRGDTLLTCSPGRFKNGCNLFAKLSVQFCGVVRRRFAKRLLGRLGPAHRSTQTGPHVSFALLCVLQRVRYCAQILLDLALVETSPFSIERLLHDLDWIDSGI